MSDVLNILDSLKKAITERMARWQSSSLSSTSQNGPTSHNESSSHNISTSQNGSSSQHSDSSKKTSNLQSDSHEKAIEQLNAPIKLSTEQSKSSKDASAGQSNSHTKSYSQQSNSPINSSYQQSNTFKTPLSGVPSLKYNPQFYSNESIQSEPPNSAIDGGSADLKYSQNKHTSNYVAKDSSGGPANLTYSFAQQTIKTARETTSNRPTNSNLISVQHLLEILQKKANVLILDLREAEVFIHGHIKWRHGSNGGCINIEPSFLIDGQTMDDIADLLQIFGATLKCKKLFESRSIMDEVIIMDAYSTSATAEITVAIGMLKRERIESKILIGGFSAWEKFLKENMGIQMYEWIGSGGESGRNSRIDENLMAKVENRMTSSTLNSINGIADRQKNIIATPVSSSDNGYNQQGLPRNLPANSSLRESGTLNKENSIVSGSSNSNTSYSSSLKKEQVTIDTNQPKFNSLKEYSPSSTAFDDPFFVFKNTENDSVKYYNRPPLIPSPNSYTTQPKIYQEIVMPYDDPPKVLYPSVSSSFDSKDEILDFEAKYPQVGTVPPPVPEKKISMAQRNANMFSRPHPQIPNVDALDYSFSNRDQFNGGPNQISSNKPQMQANYKETASQQPNIAPPPLPKKTGSSQISLTQLGGVIVRPPALSESNFNRSPNQNSTPPPLPKKPSLRRASSPSGSSLTQQYFDSPINGQNSYQPQMSASIGMAGLKNLGNTCFMNSIIQCLSATVPLSRYFLGGSYRRHINRDNPLSSKGKIAEAYSSLIKSIWSEHESVINPSAFKNVIGSFHSSFAGNEQQDSQEFLAFFLDALHEDMNLARRKHVISRQDTEDDTEGIPDELLMNKEWGKYKERNWSIIVDMFQGLLKSLLQCQTCGKTSTTFNPFMYLTLPVPNKGPVSIEDCLLKFVEREVLEGADAWYIDLNVRFCPRCKQNRKATKTLTIARLPMVLLIHLKRFSFQGPFRDKVETSLDLTRFLPMKRNGSGMIDRYEYNLYGISNHFGGLNGGHYTAQIKNNYQSQWYNFDDSRVSVSNERSVKDGDGWQFFNERLVVRGSISKDVNRYN